MRKFLAIFAAKTASFGSKSLGRGGGGALPGLIAQRIYPEIIFDLSRQFPSGIIIVTGTNGKTTTAKMITEIFRQAGLKVVSNQGGSNLSRGLASALIEESTLRGKLTQDLAVFEVDEATMPQVTAGLKPKIIVVTNIFRDQLDRYGEVDKTAAIIKSAIASSPHSALILNADDALVSSLGDKRTVSYYGLSDSKIKAGNDLAIDSKDCPACSHELIFKRRNYGHLGDYSCPQCDFKRPRLNFAARSIRIEAERIEASLEGTSEKSLSIPVSGLFNLYNAIAAIAVAKKSGIKEAIIFKTLKNFRSAFGRMEKLQLKGRKTFIHLIKNPTGMNQVLETIDSYGEKGVALIALNDNFADGTDISWIWDADFEIIKNIFRRVIISGIRAEDLAVRLKYSQYPEDSYFLEKDLKKALEKTLSEAKGNEPLYVLPTYTAMLQLRTILVKEKVLKNYWKNN